MDEVVRTSATTRLAAAIRAKRVSSEEVVAAHLRRIDQVNPGLNAVVQLAADRALAEARQADAALARGMFSAPSTASPSPQRTPSTRPGWSPPRGCRSGPPSCRLPTTGSSPACERRDPPREDELPARRRRQGHRQPVYGRTANPYAPAIALVAAAAGAAIIAAGGSLGLGSDSEAACGCLPTTAGSRR